MPKNLVVCSDGTGNTAVKNRGTNVFKIFEAVDLNGHRSDPHLTPQIALYDDGVGTESFKPIKLAGGAFGFGLGRNVRQLYKELARIYDPKDQIYLFGFSRGAFTVRTLAGFIAKRGLLDPSNIATADDLEAAVKHEYREYRRGRHPVLVDKFMPAGGGKARATADGQYLKHPDVRIRFIGVWDTVYAVGLPFHLGDIVNSLVFRFKFTNFQLSPIVDQACHALAIDDERQTFFPLLWDERGEDPARTPKRIEQVWFAGAHSNVGGGYPKQGMSLVALDWIMTRARPEGLRFVETDRALARDHANVDDKLYDPRAGLGIFYRWKPRNIPRLCGDRGVREPLIHISVLERVAHGTDDYAPGNLPSEAVVAVTPEEDRAKTSLLAARAAMIEDTLRRHDPDLLPTVRGPIAVGVLSYYVYLVACTLTLFAVALEGDFGRLRQPVEAASTTLGLIGRLAMGEWGEGVQAIRRLLSQWPLLIGMAAAFLLALALSSAADRRMRTQFSRHWHQVRPQLRDALRAARRIMTQA